MYIILSMLLCLISNMVDVRKYSLDFIKPHHKWAKIYIYKRQCMDIKIITIKLNNI